MEGFIRWSEAVQESLHAKADVEIDSYAAFASRIFWIISESHKANLFEDEAGKELEAILVPYSDPEKLADLEGDRLLLDATKEKWDVLGHAAREMKIRHWLAKKKKCEAVDLPPPPYPFLAYKRDEYAKNEKHPFPGYISTLVVQGKLPNKAHFQEHFEKVLTTQQIDELRNYRGALNDQHPGPRRDDIRVYGWKANPPRKTGYPILTLEQEEEYKQHEERKRARRREAIAEYNRKREEEEEEATRAEVERKAQEGKEEEEKTEKADSDESDYAEADVTEALAKAAEIQGPRGGLRSRSR